MVRFLTSPTAAVIVFSLLTATFVFSGVLGCRPDPAPERAEAPARPATPAPAPAERIQPAPVAPIASPAAVETPEPVTAEEPEPIVIAPPVRELPAEVVEDAADRMPVPAKLTPPDLTVLESALARGVASRSPQDPGTRFAADGTPVWAWVKVQNRGDEEHVWMVWRQGDQVRSRVRLKVGTSPGWRTWSRHTMRSARDHGAWVVDVQGENGDLLHRLRFDVGAEGVPLAGE